MTELIQNTSALIVCGLFFGMMVLDFDPAEGSNRKKIAWGLIIVLTIGALFVSTLWRVWGN
jgi:hypothetical protein